MWPNEPLAFSRHQVVYIHSKGGGVWAGRGEMAKERKRKTLPLCRMKFSLTEKTKVIVAWQAGWLWGRIANGDGTEMGYGDASAKFQVKSFQLAPTGHMLQNSQINFTSCETFHAFEMQMKCARLLTSPDQGGGPRSGKWKWANADGKWKCQCRWRWQCECEYECEVESEVAVKVELKAKVAAQAKV